MKKNFFSKIKALSCSIYTFLWYIRKQGYSSDKVRNLQRNGKNKILMQFALQRICENS